MWKPWVKVGWEALVSNVAESTSKMRTAGVCWIKWHRGHVDLGRSCYWAVLRMETGLKRVEEWVWIDRLATVSRDNSLREFTCAGATREQQVALGECWVRKGSTFKLKDSGSHREEEANYIEKKTVKQWCKISGCEISGHERKDLNGRWSNWF